MSVPGVGFQAQYKSFRISSCVFLADVDGVFDKSPETRGAKLIRPVILNADGTIKSMQIERGADKSLASIDTQSSRGVVHVTGGILGKINASCTIALASSSACLHLS